MKTLKVFVILILTLYLSRGIAEADFVFGEPNMVPNVNSEFSDGSPQISRDGLDLYMSSTRDGGISKIWVSRRETIKDPWSIPTKLDAPVNSAVAQNFPSLSADGLELYFSGSSNGIPNPNGYGGTDIWVLTRTSKDDLWNVPKNLGPEINSESDEYTPCISTDGLELYFASNVQGGSGYADIFVVTRQSKDDSWGEPVNLGPNVNTNQAELTPFISTDGLLLLFSRGFSKSHVHVCRRTTTADPWGPAEFFAPVNSGYPSDVWNNSPGSAEYHACFADEDSTIYFTRGSSVFATDYNIWQVEVTPIVDLNADGIVDAADMCIIVDNWHTENTLCDIAPAPMGDGFVDVQDLIVIAEHLFEETIPQGCVAYWRLDQREGNIARNSLGYNDGICNGEPLWQPTGGSVDGALEFDGIDDYVETDFVLNPADGAFSVFTWIKGGAPGQVIISQTDGDGTGQIWLGVDPSDGKLMTGLGPVMVAESIITDGEWHHIGIVVVAYQSMQFRYLYLDGVRVVMDTQFVALPFANGGMYFGTGKALEAGSFFSGLIDDVRIYDAALSAEQIEALAQ